MLIEDDDSLKAALGLLNYRNKSARTAAFASTPSSSSRDRDKEESGPQYLELNEILQGRSPPTFAMSMQSLSLTLEAEDAMQILPMSSSRSIDTQSMKIDKVKQNIAINNRNDEIASKKNNHLNDWSTPLLHNASDAPRPLSVLLSKPAGINYKIYLPTNDREKPFMQIDMDDKLTVKDAIVFILDEHQKAKLSPPLDYRGGKDKYELRLDEGDGEPDYDIPIDNGQKLKDLNERAFCLCDKTDFGSDFGSDDEDFGGLKASVVAKIKGGHERSRGDSANIATDTPADMVSIVVPNRRPVLLPFNDETTLRDLLLPLADQVKNLRLYSEEFEFSVSLEDQRRLSFAYPIMKIDDKICNTGTRIFELKRKVYADSVKLVKLEKLPTMASGIDRVVGNRILYNDELAGVYQQWNIVKANAMGKKQRRVIGVDATTVYNAKRGEDPRVTQKGVATAQRPIASIKSVIKIDDITFRINFGDESREFTCELANDCNEIITKLEYLLKMRKANN